MKSSVTNILSASILLEPFITPVSSQEEFDVRSVLVSSLFNHSIEGKPSAIDILIDAIGDTLIAFEMESVGIEDVTPIDVIKFLMKEHGLTQSQLPEIGSQGVVSEILSGARELNIRQVKALSERFSISVECFI